MGKNRNSYPTAQLAPLPQDLHILGDVERVVVAAVPVEPLLGIHAVGATGLGEETNVGRDRLQGTLEGGSEQRQAQEK